MAGKKLTDKPIASAVNNNDKLFLNQGNAIKQVEVATLKQAIGTEKDVNLLQNAFFVEPNNADPRGSKYCIVGGNDDVRRGWVDNAVPILLDPKTGFYCELDPNDMRFTADGVQVFDGTNVNADFANAEWMGIIPEYKQYIQDVQIGGVTHQRVWVGDNSLAGGKTIPQQCVGMFKSYNASSKMHSRPGVIPSANFTVYNGWQYAQNTDPKCGLAGIEFRTHRLHRLMAKYGYRSVQEVKDASQALIFGVGLDGTENTTGSAGDGFARQKNIKTGATLQLGKGDGKVAVQDSAGGTCHSILDDIFENDYGQYWEFVGNLCSLANDAQNRVIHILENTMPKNGSTFITAPTEADFAHIRHEVLKRASSGDRTLVDANEQIYQAMPIGSVSGVDDGDNVYYATTGRVWLWGGYSDNGANCGLGFSSSNLGWTISPSDISARLAFFGLLQKTTSQHLKTLLAQH